MKTIISWNVNGIRAAEKKGFFTWFRETSPDILCLQETKAHANQLEAIFLDVAGYSCRYVAGEKKGYSGVALYSREKPKDIRLLGINEFDCEGRVLIAEYDSFVVLNCYFPNSRDGGERLSYKLEFCRALKETSDSLVKSGANVLICGDFNIAHKPIDLENPARNTMNAGYLPEERAWMDSFLEGGYVDTFRLFHPEPKNYTWWSYMFKAREKNIGWRIDYHCVNSGFQSRVVSSLIRPDVYGSDHCPVEIVLDV